MSVKLENSYQSTRSTIYRSKMELELGINSHDILTSRSYAWSNYSVYLPFFRSTKDHTLHIQSTDGNASASPFACSFNYNSCNGSLLAVADEEGHVKILDCSAPDIKYRLVSWRQHHNAIFDLLWSNNDTKIWTASGDQSIKCFDLDSSKDVMTISGFHSTSIKNISMRNDHEIASGGRDGQIIIIDSRQSKTPTAHFTKTQTTIKRKRLSNLKPHRSSIFQPESITGLQFISDYLLAASYAPSGDLALWDIRYSKSNTPHSILSYGNTCSSNHSLTSFICNSSGSIIYGTSTDHHVYTYSTVSNNSSQILQSLTTDAFSCKSFYVKSSISFDDRYLLTGSSLNGAIIWDLESLDAFQLMGHEGEVTSVAWCRHSHDLIATCSDDSTVRLWSIETRIKDTIYSRVTSGKIKKHKIIIPDVNITQNQDNKKRINQFFTPSKPNTIIINKENE